MAALPGPAAELARRDEPPVLRLVWPTDEAPRAGFDTEVRLPLRPGVDGAALLAQARAGAPDLLLVLPDLVEIEVAGTVLRRAEPATGRGDDRRRGAGGWPAGPARWPRPTPRRRPPSSARGATGRSAGRCR